MARTDEPQAMTWRQRRIAMLIERVQADAYEVPAIDVAHAILHGRPRFGDNPVIAIGGEVRVTVESTPS